MDNTIWVMENITYNIEGGEPVIKLFSRNYNNKYETITHEVKGFEPYFYVPKGTDGLIPIGDKYIRHPYIKRIENDIIIDALGREVQKCVTYMPSQVSEVRELFKPFTDMSDFLFDKRYLSDTKIKYTYKWNGDHAIPFEVDNPLLPRIIYFDIEVLSPEGIMPDADDANYPIVSIQCMDSYTEKIVIFTYNVDIVDDRQFNFNNEKDLLKMFCTYIKEIDPDVLAGWNTSFFDFPYIINRAEKIRCPLNGLSRTNYIRCIKRDNKYNIQIKGRSLLDMLEAFKKFTSGQAQLESYALKSVISNAELLKEYAFSYFDYGPYLEKLLTITKDYRSFIDYCVNDVVALKNIDKAIGLYLFYENIRKISGCYLDDVMNNSRIIEMLLIHEDIKPMPRKNTYSDDNSDIEGALVIEPIPGVSEWVGTYDLASLYPTILIAFNKSPDIDGILVKTLAKTMQMREDLRDACKNDPDNEVLENMQMAIKFLNNSYYGVLGLKSFRLYNKEIAEFITATGRELNRFLQQIAKENNYMVMAGDTDAIMVTMIPDYIKGIEFEKILNDRLHEWSIERNCKIDFKLKFEKLYRRLLFKRDRSGHGIKKKYCGYIIWENGRDKSSNNELNYKGIELKRSDQANITKDCLSVFLNKLLIDGNNIEAAEYVKIKYKEVLHGKASLYDISIPKAVRKLDYVHENPWVRGIKYIKDKYNYNITDGTKPRLIYLKYGEICIDDDFDISQITDEIDFDHQAYVVIRKKMESYIWSVGLSWNSVINGQQSITKWF